MIDRVVFSSELSFCVRVVCYVAELVEPGDVVLPIAQQLVAKMHGPPY